MKRFVLAAFAVGLTTGIAGMALIGHFKRARPPQNESPPAATPTGPVSADAIAAFESGLRSEKAGYFEAAANNYLKAFELDPGYVSAGLKLGSLPASIPESTRKRIADRVTEMFTNALAEKRDEEARSLAPLVVKLNPDCEGAHRILGDEQIDGKWYDKDEVDLVRVSKSKSDELEAYYRMPPREKIRYSLTQDFGRQFGKKKEELAWLDCSPDAPFAICMEKVPTYDTAGLLADIRACAKAHFNQFRELFGKEFAAESLCAHEVCPIYIFSSESRYRSGTQELDDFEAHPIPITGQSLMYRGSPDFQRSLFHEFTLQLLNTIRAMAVHPPLPPGGKEPCWFAEGLAAYLEGFTSDGKGEYVFSASTPEQIAAAKKLLSDTGHRTLYELMSVTWNRRRNLALSDTGQAQILSVHSWAATLFLLNAPDRKRREQYLAYFTLELNGTGSPGAATKCFGDLDSLNKEFEEYVRGLK